MPNFDGSGNPHAPKTTKMVIVFNCNLGSVRYMNINIAFSFHLHKVMDCIHGDAERINNRVGRIIRTIILFIRKKTKKTLGSGEYIVVSNYNLLFPIEKNYNLLFHIV